MSSSTGKSSAQRLSNGTLRVGSTRGRSAITGRFVTKTTPKRLPGSTVSGAAKGGRKDSSR